MPIVGRLAERVVGNQAPHTHMINVAGNVYAVVNEDDGLDGFVRTVTITPSTGAISTVIDTLEFDTVEGQTAFIFPVSGDIFGIAYSGPDDDGFIVTVDIDSAGNIGAAVVASFEFEAVSVVIDLTVVPVGGQIYAIFYGSATGGDTPKVATVDISNDGLTMSLVDTQTSTGRGRRMDSTAVSGDIFAVAGSVLSPANNHIDTWDIDSLGTIAATAEERFVYASGITNRVPHLLHVTGTVYALVNNAGSTGRLYTVDIPNSGIGMSSIASLDFSSIAIREVDQIDLIQVSGSFYVVVWVDDASGDGFMALVHITDNGEGLTLVDTFEFEGNGSSGTNPSAILVTAAGGPNGNAVVAIFYFRVDGPGDAQVITVEVSPTLGFAGGPPNQKLLLLS